MSKQDVAVYGGSFNPPGIHHELIIKKLLQNFKKVIVIPCGFRKDKIKEENKKDFIEPKFRKELIKLAFRDIVKLGAEIDFFDLENELFTRTIDLYERLKHKGNLWFVVGADLVVGGRFEGSEIQLTWKNGNWLWNNLNFVVLERPGLQIEEDDLPKNNRLIQSEVGGSSSVIRDNIRTKKPLHGLLSSDVEKVIFQRNLYT